MDKIDIESVAHSGLEELHAIARQTFYETFVDENTEDNINRYLTQNFSLQQLSDELNNPDSEFYFATIKKEIIGYLKLNFGKAQSVENDQDGLEIERIYILKKYHGKKVGQFLFDKTLKIAKENNSRYLWLGVWEKNLRAIRFYEKNGFREFDKHLFILGNDKQTDILMKLEL